MTEGTFSGIMLRAFCGALGLQGVDVTALLAELGIDRKGVSDGSARIPARLAFELFERAPALTRDPAFGLHAAMGMPVGLLEALDCAVRDAGTAGAALGRVCRYFSFVDDANVLEMKPAPGGWALETRRRDGGGPPMPAVAAELLFAMIVARGRELTHTSMPLVEVGFAHPPTDPLEHGRFFGCSVRFGSPTNHLVLVPEWLDVPIVEDVETSLSRLLASPEPAAPPAPGRSGSGSSLVAAAPRDLGSTARAVRAALGDEIRGEVPSVDAIAARLGRLPAELLEELGEERVAWAELVDDAQREIAARCLEHTSLPPAEIAFLAGFESSAAFEQALAGWSRASAVGRAATSTHASPPPPRVAKASAGADPLERKSGTRATSRSVPKRKVARRR